MNKKFRKKFGKCLQIQKKVTTFAPAIEREILDKKDGPFVYRLGRKIFILERGFDSPRATNKNNKRTKLKISRNGKSQIIIKENQTGREEKTS